MQERKRFASDLIVTALKPTKMRRIIIAVIMTAVSAAAIAQKGVTLWQCYDSAEVATPLSGEKELIRRMTSLRDQNLAAAWLPSLDLNGIFAYQSEVVDMSDLFSSMPIPPGSLPSVPHEQYRATVDLSQVIWDGGVTRSARAVEQVISELNMQQNEADIYRLREQVNNFYFPLLMIRNQIEVTGIVISDLDARLLEAASALENGIVSSMTVDVLKAEKIKAEQGLSDLYRRRDAFAKALEQITGITGIGNAELMLPETVITGDETIDNPDLRLFSTRSRQLELSKNLLKSQRMPKAFGFAQAGYGNPPGNNFLSDNPDLFFSLGAGFKWNIYDWNKNSNERKSLTIQQDLLTLKKQVLEENLERLLTLKMAEIMALRDASGRDEEIIMIRKRIAATAASQLENGIITASQYLTELNNEKQAIVNAAMRRISLARAGVDYTYITGQNK